MSRGGPISEKHWRERGHGEGAGAEYRPWLTVRSFGSRGIAHRIPGAKVHRVHHLHSNLEWSCFLLLEWNDHVVDIREQYPMHPLTETQEIAAGLGCRHPAQRRKRRGFHFNEERTMTTDFLVSFSRPAPSPEVAISVKPSSELKNTRTLQKLEIERRYWTHRGIPWRLVTEKDMPATAVRNLKLIRPCRDLESHGLAGIDVSVLLPKLYRRLSGSSLPVGRICKKLDEEVALPRGASLTLLWHALATKVWRANLHRELCPARVLSGLRWT